MAEGFVNVTEGSGKKLHTFNRTIGANDVHDEGMFNAEPNLATYTVNTGGTSIATANDHILQVMAGGTLNLYIRRVMVYQVALATTAAIGTFQILRLTTAGTGGTAQGVGAFDTGDAAAGGTGMTLPTVKGTESSVLWRGTYGLQQTAPTAGVSTLMFDLVFDQLRAKAIRVAAGTANGIAFKSTTAVAACTIQINVFFSEANF